MPLNAPLPLPPLPAAAGSFYNQRLRAWHPILTPTWTVVAFIIVAVVFIPVGIVLKGASDGVKEVSCKYSSLTSDSSTCDLEDCAFEPSGNRSVVRSCTLKLTVSERMEAPVYMYYELDQFYQNHRRYVKSRDDRQLKGELRSAADLTTTCDPLVYGDIPNPEGQSRILHPCGLIANSYFNDTFTLASASLAGNSVDAGLDETGIAWATDRTNKFQAVAPTVKDQNKGQYQFISETYPGLVDVTNEHFIVWMRTAALPKFRKLYARFNTTLEANTELVFKIGVNFPVSAFSGSKSVVISTVSFLGGKNDFLGIAYIVVGATCAALAIAFAVKEWFCPRRPGDVKFLRLPTR